MFDLLLKQ